MGFAEDYGFADYLRTPLRTVTDSKTGQAGQVDRDEDRQDRMFRMVTDTRTEDRDRKFSIFRVGDEDVAWGATFSRQDLQWGVRLVAKTLAYRDTSGYDELLKAVESFDILWSSADSIPPIEFARRLTNLFGLFSFLKAPADTKFTLALLGNKIGKRNLEWLSKARSLFYEKKPEEWMTPPEMVRHISGNLGSPTYAIETRNTTPVAMATVKQDDKKKKKKEGNCPRHSKGVHDDEECREHPDKKKATEPSKAVTIGRSSGTALFTSVLCPILNRRGSRSSRPLVRRLLCFLPHGRKQEPPRQFQTNRTITINTRTSTGTKVLLTLEDVRLVQGLSKNLISTSQLWQNGGVHLDQRVLALKGPHSEGELAIVRPLGGVYHILGFAEVQPEPSALATTAQNRPQPIERSSTAPTKLSLWHRRLGHISPSYIQKAVSRAKGLDISDADVKSGDKCTPCWTANPAKQTYATASETRTQKIGDRIHADLIGPITPASSEGYRYVLLIIDDATRHVWTKLLVTKQADNVPNTY
ncbi:hypothetical protein HOO65_050458 [Ceratocystis lukuohia]|uniref:GAG-pre-integrase domain-containing protein n=1 Tax=Ceratocystis lukuohia TaxID=2019550 RepID=A0ABR4MGD4_9PEZI